MIATMLSSTPGLKKLIKRVYVGINALIHKKPYRVNYIAKDTGEIQFPFSSSQEESFFGYYDKVPDTRSGLILGCLTSLPTHAKPCANRAITVAVTRYNSIDYISAATTASYNWQQGCRAQWISESKFIYNTFDSGKYKAAIIDMENFPEVAETKRFDMPVQDAYREDYFLSINYRRIMALRPDYGYRNMPKISKEEISDLNHDGIWKVDMKSGKAEMALTLADVALFYPKDSFTDSQHKVNHLMISPDGKKFIFIHRWYKGGRRHDRLLLSDFNCLKLLADEDMVSHMCWIDDNTVFGYLRHGGENGFYFIDVTTGIFKPCSDLTDLRSGDGHPSCHGNWIVVDTYPDKSRMQTLILYNYKTGKLVRLLEVFHPLKFSGETRCDLHPRFSCDGKRIFFDTLFSGKRQLAYVNVEKIVMNS